MVQRQHELDDSRLPRVGPIFAIRSSEPNRADEPLADVGDADAGACDRRLPGKLAGRPRLADPDREPAGPGFARNDARRTVLRLARLALLDRIFDDRLQDQSRKPRLFEILGNVDLGLQPARETHPLNVEIEPLQSDLFGEADVRPASSVRL